MQGEQLVIHGINFGPAPTVNGFGATSISRTIAGVSTEITGKDGNPRRVDYPRADFELWYNHPNDTIQDSLRQMVNELGELETTSGAYRSLQIRLEDFKQSLREQRLETLSQFGTTENYVTVGDRLCPHSFWNDTYIVCKPPEGTGNSDVRVNVFNRQGGPTDRAYSISERETWTYAYDRPVVEHVYMEADPGRPTHGTTDGGEIVILEGRNFGRYFSGSAIRPQITIGSLDPIGVISPLSTNRATWYHNRLVIRTPEATRPDSMGAALNITVTRGNAKSAPVALFGFDPPIITSIRERVSPQDQRLEYKPNITTEEDWNVFYFAPPKGSPSVAHSGARLLGTESTQWDYERSWRAVSYDGQHGLLPARRVKVPQAHHWR